MHAGRTGVFYRAVGILAEVLSETLYNLLDKAEDPFEAFDNYKENYDDVLCESARR
ncbi:MAG: hypothetical protein IJ716_17345 [Lachnospiraceae bacterium]|nr:hypothetical protein [Lachnospiraceae bacterium]